MISIKNKQRAIPIDRTRLLKQAKLILAALKYSDFELNIVITTEKDIAVYNEKFRNKKGPTDVLSFPYHETKAGKRIIAEPDEQILGDLIIAPAYVARNTKELPGSFEDHMRLMLVHGVLHLLGYDHIKDADYKVMRRKELALEKALKAARI
jgi:probable rRNA maturation factor